MVGPILIIAIPIVLIVAPAFGLRFGLPYRLIIPLDAAVLGVAGYFLHEGVERSCLMGASECIGATATAYIVLGLWFVAVVILIISAVRNSKAQRRDTADRT